MSPCKERHCLVCGAEYVAESCGSAPELCDACNGNVVNAWTQHHWFNTSKLQLTSDQQQLRTIAKLLVHAKNALEDRSEIAEPIALGIIQGILEVIDERTYEQREGEREESIADCGCEA